MFCKDSKELMELIFSGTKSNLAKFHSTKSSPNDVSSKFNSSISNQSAFELWKPKFSRVSWFGWVHGSWTIRRCHSCQHARIFSRKSTFGTQTIREFEFWFSPLDRVTNSNNFRINSKYRFWFEYRRNLSNAI